MPKVIFTLEEQFSDLRSKEVAYKFTIENQGPSGIELLSISPRIPEDVVLKELKESSFVAVKAKHAELCAELTELIKDHLLITSKEVREKALQIEIDQLKAAVESVSNPFRGYLELLSGRFSKNLAEQRKRSNAFTFKIENVKDGHLALKEWFEVTDASNMITKEIFEAKLKQLQQLGNDSDPEFKSASIATIEPGSLFSMTYILKFPRYMLSPRKFNMAIEASYSELDKKYIGGAAASIIISPVPFTITLLAVVASLMGVVLKVAIEKQSISRREIGRALIGSPGISAVILAIIFFNVYEHTDLGKKLAFGVGWRGALLIGALCGIGADRILAAIKALIFGGG
ncbi:MAG: hypothetical protein ACXW3C_05400 [Pyrinomonadaceae bacterium]